jgi:putative flippase GtrA
MTARGFGRRWLAFNGVGVLGVGVQLGVLTLLLHGFGLHYLVATAIAVEIAVLHNFIWHQHWTWRDRPSPSAAAVARRLARFHLLNGTVSLFGNLAIMTVLCGTLRIDAVAANVVAIGVCSMLNFVASEVLVFKAATVAVTGLLVFAGSIAGPSRVRAAEMPGVAITASMSTVATAELSAAAIAAWQQYIRHVDDRYAQAATSEPFFVHDVFKLAPEWRADVTNGQVSMVRMASFAPGAPEPSVPDGRIHHWAGAVFIPGVTLDHVLTYLNERAGRESDAFDDVLSSRLIARDGDRLRVFMKLRRESVMTVTYNTEHDVQYRRITDTRASSRSVATRIAELEGAGTPQEREKPVGNDHGFLWRLNAYWRYEQVKGGVLIECESVSLSRGVPVLLRPFVTGTVERIARESLQKTLVSLRTELGKSRRAAALRSQAGRADGYGSR